MLGFIDTNDESRDSAADDIQDPPEKIDVSHYLDEIERVLRCGSDVGMRNEVLAILRRWQFDTMLTAASCSRAARLLREFTEFTRPHKVSP